ncbi:MAG TPA: hypothetical protein DCS80_05575 [Betaproteobacteria bacterium]|jgi:hypothetical protein|nr:hypothetical protein [Betaproteobacteria bacterium]
MFIEIFESNSLSAVHKLARDKYGDDIFIVRCFQEKERFKILVACDGQHENLSRANLNNLKGSVDALSKAESQENDDNYTKPNLIQDEASRKLSILEMIPKEKTINFRDKRIIFFENEAQRLRFSKALHKSASGFDFVHLLGKKSVETIKLSAASPRDYSIDSMDGLLKYIISQPRESVVVGTALLNELANIDDKVHPADLKMTVAISEFSVNHFYLNKECKDIDEIFITDLNEDSNYLNIGALFAKSNIPPSLGLTRDPFGRFITLNRDVIISKAKKLSSEKLLDPAIELKLALSKLSRSMEAPNESYHHSRS